MSDEIVKRLGDLAARFGKCRDASLCIDAADEIERLRAALEKIAQHDMQAIAMNALRPRISAAEKKEDVQKFEFDRYVNGNLMASGVLVFAENIAQAMRKASKLCPEQNTVLALRSVTDFVPQMRLRKPQLPTPAYSVEKIEKRIDEICGCNGKWDCDCVSVFSRASIQLWSEYNLAQSKDKKP